MGDKARTKSVVTLMIIFLIPLLLISNGAYMISGHITTSDDPVATMGNNFFVAGVPVIHMDRQQVAQVITDVIADVSDQKINLVVDEQQWQLNIADLQVEYDVEATVKEVFSLTSLSSRQNIPLVVKYDRAKLKRFIEEIAGQVNVQPVNAEIVLRGSSIEKVPERQGKMLNIESALHAVHLLLANGLLENEVKISLQSVDPSVTMSDIRDVDKHFTRFSTTVDLQDDNRIYNIQRAIELLHPLVIRSQETMSFNQLVSPYTADRGYMIAPVLNEGSVAEGIGGGVCQLSSTLFVAAAKSGLEFKEYHNHSVVVPYVAAGYDATVSDLADLKIYNPLKKNIYITFSYHAPEVTVDVFGNHIDYRDYSLFIKNDYTVNEGKLEATGYRGELFRKWNYENVPNEQKITDFYYPPVDDAKEATRQQQLGFMYMRKM